MRRGVEEEEEEDEAGPRKLLNQADTAGSSPEDAHNLIHVCNLPSTPLLVHLSPEREAGLVLETLSFSIRRSRSRGDNDGKGSGEG